MHEQPVPEHQNMTGREIVRRVALWLVTGFLLTLLAGIIGSLVAHHDGQTAARITGLVYVVVSVIIFALIRGRRHAQRA